METELTAGVDAREREHTPVCSSVDCGQPRQLGTGTKRSGLTHVEGHHLEVARPEVQVEDGFEVCSRQRSTFVVPCDPH
jgi:hypothetical protein